jgi:hypothetical protein
MMCLLVGGEARAADAWGAPENLFVGRGQSVAQNQAHNRQMLDRLSQPPQPGANPKRASAFTRAQAHRLFDTVGTHEVVRNVAKFDPTGRVEFCFGKATVAHFEALRMGMDRTQIAKLWVIYGPTAKWSHHVATAVQAQEGGWWVIDPLLPGPVKVDEWFRHYEKDDPGNARLYVTTPERFGPAFPNRYERAELASPFYHGFFDAARAEMRRRVMQPAPPPINN